MHWRHQPRVWLAIAGALLFWAAAFAGIRAGLKGYGPGELALLRFATASATLGVIALITRMRPPDRGDLPLIALAGFVGITIYHVALNFGEQSVEAGAAAVLISTSPVFTAILSTWFLHEHLTGWGWLGVFVAFAGAVVIAFGQGQGVSFNADALLVLLAAISTSVYFILCKPPLRRYTALEFTSYTIWAGTIPMLVFAPGLVSQIPHAPPSSTLAALFLGVFPGALAYVMWAYALSRMRASTLTMFLYFQPVNAAIIAWIWLGEVPAWLTVIGGAISIAGVVLVSTRGAARE